MIGSAIIGGGFGAPMGMVDTVGNRIAMGKQKKELLKMVNTGNEVIDAQLRNYVDMVNQTATDLEDLVAARSRVYAKNIIGTKEAKAKKVMLEQQPAENNIFGFNESTDVQQNEAAEPIVSTAPITTESAVEITPDFNQFQPQNLIPPTQAGEQVNAAQIAEPLNQQIKNSIIEPTEADINSEVTDEIERVWKGKQNGQPFLSAKEAEISATFKDAKNGGLNPMVIERNGSFLVEMDDVNQFANEDSDFVGDNFSDDDIDSYYDSYNGGYDDSPRFSKSSLPNDYVRDLMVTHNISADGILHADKMGGVPYASVAITKQEQPLENFGEVTLIGDKNYIDPKGENKAKVFGSDIYSPRYPKVNYEYSEADKKAIKEMFAQSAKENNDNVFDYNFGEGLKDTGLRQALFNSEAVKWQFLKDKGLTYEVVYRESPKSEYADYQIIKNAIKNGIDVNNALQDRDFLLSFMHERIDRLENRYKNNPNPLLQNKVNRIKDDLNADTETLSKTNGRFIREAFEKRVSTNEVDFARTASNRNREIERHSDEFRDYVDNVISKFTAKEKFRTGENRSGKATYAEHTLENVVKKLKKDLRGGESFNYGLPTIRAKVTPQFKSIKDIQQNKERLVTHKNFQNIKKEMEVAQDKLAEQLGVSTLDIENVLWNVVDENVAAAFHYADIENTAENRQAIAEFLGKLKAMPTEYFEGKGKDITKFSDFKGAVIPKDLPLKARQVLEKSGLSLYEYDRNIQGNRGEVIRNASLALDEKHHNQVLFSLNESADSDFAKAVDKVTNNEPIKGKYINVGTTPKVLQMIGLPDVNIDISVDVLNKVMGGKHNITADTLKQLPSQINNPVAVMKSDSNSSNPNGYVVLTELLEKDTQTGKNKPVIGALHLKTTKSGIELINITSVYGRSNSQIQRGLENDLLYWNKEKGRHFINRLGLQLSPRLGSSNNLSASNIKTETELSQYQSAKNQPQAIDTQKFKQIVTKAVGESAVKNVNVVTRDSATAPNGEVLSSGVEGWFDPKTNQITLIADSIHATPTMTKEQRLAWVAWHELAHRGVNVRLKREYKSVMHRADSHAVINAVATAIQQDRLAQQDPAANNRSIAVEEAIAEVFSAYQTGNFNELESRYGVKVSQLQRKGFKTWLERFADKVRALIDKLFGTETADKFSNDDLVMLMTEIKKGVEGESAVKNQNVLFSTQSKSDSFKATEAKYGGEKAYNQAKTDGKTELDYHQWVQVRTPEFKAWFGDWENDPENASKVINKETGEPLVVYHGRDMEFNIFDRNELGGNTYSNATLTNIAMTAALGHWFSTQDIAAETGIYSKTLAAFLNIREPKNYTSLWYDLAEQTDMRVPLDENGDPKSNLDDFEDTQEITNAADAYREELEEDGYDGLIIKSDEEFGGSSFVAFNANQIKSATDNNGAFSAESDDIRYSNYK